VICRDIEFTNPTGERGVPGEVTTTIVVSRATLIHPVPLLGGGARSHRVLFAQTA
jgi:hypothetical protein